MKKEHYKRSVFIGKWIAKELLPRTLSTCIIAPHEFCQMINHLDDPLSLYWRHYQPVNSIESFIECLDLKGKEIVVSTVSFIKSNVGSEINELEDKNILRDIVFQDNDDVTIDQIEQLFKCFLVAYLYLAPPKLISSFYESITSKKYFLGYRGITFLFSNNNYTQRNYFMRIASCYLEAEFFICEELSNTLLVNYDTFRIGFDAQLDSLTYNTC